MNLTRILAVAAWALVLITSPVVIPIVFILWLSRWIIVMLSTLCRSDLLEPIKDLELSFCADDFWNRPLGSNAFVWILQGPIDFSVVEGRMKELLRNGGKDYDRLVRFHPTVWLNVPFWCQTRNFVLADHMKIHVDKNIGSEEELRGFICEYLQSPFPKGQPCWDASYVHNVDIKTGSGLEKRALFIFRVHHIVGDGLSMLQFLQDISDGEQRAFVRSAGPSVKKEMECGSWSGFFHDQLRCLFYAPLVLVHQIKEFACHSDFLTSKKKSQELALSWTTVPFQRVKSLRQELFKSGNQLPTIAAYNWIISGAMRQYWKRDGNMTDEELRGAGNLIASLPSEGHRSEKFQNAWTHGIFRLPLDEPCPRTRRKMILENCGWVSRLNTPRVFTFLLPLQRLLPYGVLQRIVRRNMGAPVGLTNIAGPQRPVYLGGQRVVGKYAIVGLQWPHASLSYGFFTYNGTLSVSLLGNQEIFGSQFLHQQAAGKILNNYFHHELLLEEKTSDESSFDKSGE